MDVTVCAKQIPDPATLVRLDPTTYRLVREGKFLLDDADAYGVEMALRLVEAAGAGEVRLVSMTPGGEVAGLRTALAMGAARATLVSDDALGGCDALSTAKVLAAAIKRDPPDLVVAATESTDGYTGTVPVAVAELLGWPSASFAKAVSLDGNVLHVERQTEAGWDQVEVPLPAVVTVTAGVVEVRYPNFRGIMAARNKPIEVLTLAELGLEPASVGGEAAGQAVLSVEPAPARGGGRVVVDEGQAHSDIVAFLDELKVL